MNFASWAPIFILVAVFTLWCLWHLIRNDATFMPKWAWAVIIVVAMPLGGIVYVLVSVLDAGETRADAEGRAPKA
jgi:hypothetical protein